MKKWLIFLFVSAILLIGGFFYFQRNFSKVTVFINDIDKVKIYYVHNGKTLKKLKTPSMSGYAFSGWFFLDSEEEFDENTKVVEDIVLVAKWAKINFE